METAKDGTSCPAPHDINTMILVFRRYLEILSTRPNSTLRTVPQAVLLELVSIPEEFHEVGIPVPVYVITAAKREISSRDVAFRDHDVSGPHICRPWLYLLVNKRKPMLAKTTRLSSFLFFIDLIDRFSEVLLLEKLPSEVNPE